MADSSQQIFTLIETFKFENEKFMSGNKAAGTRARKALMEIKKACDTRRKEIQAEKTAA